MCDETGADYCYEGGSDFVASTLVRNARTEHVCTECGRRVQPGQHYTRLAGVFDGQFWSDKLCGTCDLKRRWLSRRGHAWVIGLIGSDFEYCLNPAAFPDGPPVEP